MPEQKEEIKIIIEMLATHDTINAELADLLRDIRELAESKGFVVLL